MLPLVYVLTVNWNHADDTRRLLASCEQLTYGNLRLLVVDNGSQPDCVEQIRAGFPYVEWVINERNLGFAAGVNAGLRQALAHEAEYVLLLNNDTTVAADMLDRLIVAAEGPGVGATAPIIYYAGDHPRIWSAGAYCRALTRDLRGSRHGEIDSGSGAAPYEVDYATACGLLVSRACLERVGLFDERFFMYYEDLDFCWRARAAGYRIVVDPRAYMWHAVAATIGGSDSPDERYHMALASVKFYRKYIHGWRWSVVLPYRLFSALKTTGRLLRAGKVASACAHWRGLRDGITR